ncbi:MAG: epoxyqueuosine reductase QueH [Sphaerochaetaceae bacterium]|jgi:predicted adenine nucleotide alpha hydrolase (AANH) superfamily ATPase|nr:epoxyqueuosine reductase QueH [Sphaerochaetaceae bacterium]MDD3365960.1 epoxyqueuosine reductase QueH [Sphaerochaetaceae bacterium]MDD4218750.1 epoxyqueuosine reductase QueH [Sphaerochaetaceae bacterium]MDY0370888.1 epoxyqueuosine reductase QueH [Sphaerochaetaceae bacterium]
MDQLLLHCCCGPCSTSSIERLREEGYEPILFFGNSNIFPPEEAEKRFKALRVVADHFALKIIHQPYNHTSWLHAIKGHEQDPEQGQRCAICFAYNLAEAAQEAKRLGIPYFTTTLTVSPHKNSPLIFKVGKHWDNFVALNFKKKGGFQRSLELSRMLNLYRQDYCGCEFSKQARED